MKRKIKVIFLTIAVLASTIIPVGARSNKGEREKMLAIGKELFTKRCGSCHGESGDKPLEKGPPLSERKLTDDVIEKNVEGRFQNGTDKEKRAVALYIKSFLKRK